MQVIYHWDVLVFVLYELLLRYACKQVIDTESFVENHDPFERVETIKLYETCEVIDIDVNTDWEDDIKYPEVAY